MICKSFLREIEALSSTPRNVEKRMMDETERYARRFPRGGRPIFVDEGGSGNMPVGSVLGGKCMVTRSIVARIVGSGERQESKTKFRAIVRLLFCGARMRHDHRRPITHS